MNVNDFNQDQKQALLDLLLLGMYADHNLSSSEDQRVEQLLGTLKFSSDYERDQFSDAAFTRARQKSDSPEAMQAYVGELAKHFPGNKLRQEAYDILDDLLTSDGRVSSEESKLLSTVKDVFKL